MDEDRYTQITLRIPKDLHVQLRTQAQETSKSLNAEIVSRLQASFDSAIDKEMFLDQARQLWNARCLVAIAHFDLAASIYELEKLGYKDKDRIAKMRERMKETGEHAQLILDLTTDELLEKKRSLSGSQPPNSSV